MTAKILDFAEYSMLPREIATLRAKQPLALHVHPAADPARVLLSGHYARPEAIDRGMLFTVPAVLFEALPVLKKQSIGGPRGTEPKVWAKPSTAQLRALGASGRSSVLAIKRAAALYRILSNIHGVSMERDERLGIVLPFVQDPDVFAPNTCWVSGASRSGGHTSPVMQMDGETLTVAEVLMNLCYTTLVPFRWGLRRACAHPHCVNPWHYIHERPSRQALDTFQYAIAVPRMNTLPRLPLPMRNPVDTQLYFNASWVEWCQACFEHLGQINPHTPAQAALADEPPPPSLSDMGTEDILAALRATAVG